MPPGRSGQSSGKGSKTPAPEATERTKGGGKRSRSGSSSTAAGAKKKVKKVEVEQPPSRLALAKSIKKTLLPGKRRCIDAYDDRATKRPRMKWDAIPGSNPMAVPWLDGLGEVDRTADFVAHQQLALRLAKDNKMAKDGPPDCFARVPVEVIDNILRNLLVHDMPIRVLRGWSLVFPRTRPNLDIDVLMTCKVLYDRGIRVLYGENIFEYLIRDPSVAYANTHRVTTQVFEDEKNKTWIEKHGSLIRNIRLVAEANRMQMDEHRKNFLDGIRKFLPGQGAGGGLQAQIHTITIEMGASVAKTKLGDGSTKKKVFAKDFIGSDTPGLRALARVNCQFIRVIIHTKGPRHFECIIDRRPHFTQKSVARGSLTDPWRKDKVMLRIRKEKAKTSNARLNTLGYWVEGLARQPDDVLKQVTWIREFEYSAHAETAF